MVHIDHYDFGRIVINGTPYMHDVKILGERVVPNWWRQEGHYLQLSDIPEIEGPWDVIVIGTGKYGRMAVAPEVIQKLNTLHRSYIIEITDNAVQEFNRLVREAKNVLGAFHLTC